MRSPTPPSPEPDPSAKPPPTGPVFERISQNIDAILAFYSRETQKISRPQRLLERITAWVGRPLFLGSMVLTIVVWILVNLLARRLGFAPPDPPPFIWLQAAINLGALLIVTVVLVTQNRLAKLEELHAHLDLQVNLLTEQKTTKLIHLLEELRRDLPMVRDRHDAEAATLQQPTDPNVVLTALDERRDLDPRNPDSPAGDLP